jgi:hypothetical protein
VPGMSEVTHRPTRRLVLLGAAAASLAACTGDDRPPPATEGSPSRPEPDALLRTEVTSAERDLLALYQATVSTHPALAAQLAPFSARHRRHLDAVETSGPVATPAPTSASAPGTGPPGTPSAAPTPVAPPAVPADPAQALTALRAAERAAADTRVADCLRSEDPELAELLAAVAACEAAHDVVLGTAS